MIESFPEEEGETDPYETRMFYELMQEYRWSREPAHTVRAFDQVKAFCRSADQPTPLEFPPIDLGALR